MTKRVFVPFAVFVGSAVASIPWPVRAQADPHCQRECCGTMKEDVTLTLNLRDQTLGNSPECGALRVGSRVKLRVENFNPWLYELEVNGVPRTFNETAPTVTLQSSLSLPQPAPSAAATEKELVKDLRVAIGTSEWLRGRTDGAQKGDLAERLVARLFQDAISAMDACVGEITSTVDLRGLANLGCSDLASVSSRLAGLPESKKRGRLQAEDALRRVKSQLLGFQAKVVQLRSQVAFEQAEDEFREAITAAYKKLGTFDRQVVDVILRADGVDAEKTETAIGQLAEEWLGDDEPSSALANAAEIATEVAPRWSTLREAYAALGEADRKLREERFKELDRAWQQYHGKDEKALLDGVDGAVSYWRSLTASGFDVAAGPFLVEGDEFCIEVAVTRKAGVDAKFATNHVMPKANIACFPTVGGVKVDFSAGVFATKLSDRVYGTKTEKAADGTESRRIIRLAGEEDSFTVTPGVLVHVRPRQLGRPEWLGRPEYGLTFGLGTPTNSETVYVVGLSAFMGRNRRGVLTVGVAGGNRASLGSGYKIGDALPADVTTIPTKRVFDTRFFLGLTFNFGEPAKR